MSFDVTSGTSTDRTQAAAATHQGAPAKAASPAASTKVNAANQTAAQREESGMDASPAKAPSAVDSAATKLPVPKKTASIKAGDVTLLLPDPEKIDELSDGEVLPNLLANAITFCAIEKNLCPAGENNCAAASELRERLAKKSGPSLDAYWERIQNLRNSALPEVKKDIEAKIAALDKLGFKVKEGKIDVKQAPSDAESVPFGKNRLLVGAYAEYGQAGAGGGGVVGAQLFSTEAFALAAEAQGGYLRHPFANKPTPDLLMGAAGLNARVPALSGSAGAVVFGAGAYAGVALRAPFGTHLKTAPYAQVSGSFTAQIGKVFEFGGEFGLRATFAQVSEQVTGKRDEKNDFKLGPYGQLGVGLRFDFRAHNEP